MLTDTIEEQSLSYSEKKPGIIPMISVTEIHFLLCDCHTCMVLYSRMFVDEVIFLCNDTTNINITSTIRIPFEQLTITDDDMFKPVKKDSNRVKSFGEIVLDKKFHKVVFLKTEKMYMNVSGG